jgi:cytochrome c556
MKMRRIVLIALTGAMVAGAAAMPMAAASDRRPPARAKAMLSPEQIVEARRAAFRLSAADFQLMRTAAEKGADLNAMAGPARSLAQWATVLPTLFPAGTGPDMVATRARPEIWANRADFEQKARDYAAAATRLVEAAGAGDMAAGGQAWDATRATCSACHDRYRNEALSSPPAR